MPKQILGGNNQRGNNQRPQASATAPQIRGERVRWVLQYYGWTARELADQLAMREQRMSKLLTGHTPIETDDALRISYELRIPPDWILWGDRTRLDRKIRKQLPPHL
jgi:transcriptional regulator with XRE-family HTH domain